MSILSNVNSLANLALSIAHYNEQQKTTEATNQVKDKQQETINKIEASTKATAENTNYLKYINSEEGVKERAKIETGIKREKDKERLGNINEALKDELEYASTGISTADDVESIYRKAVSYNNDYDLNYYKDSRFADRPDNFYTNLRNARNFIANNRTAEAEWRQQQSALGKQNAYQGQAQDMAMARQKTYNQYNTIRGVLTNTGSSGGWTQEDIDNARRGIV